MAKEPPRRSVSGRRPGPIAAVVLTAVLGVALIVRVQPLLANPEVRNGGLGIFGDSWLYETLGYNLAQGNGFAVAPPRPFSLPPAAYEPVITRGPVYPFFIALVYRTMGVGASPDARARWRQLDRVRLAQAVLDGLNCLAVFGIAVAIWPGSFVPALLAALFVALCPYNVFYTRAILKETLATSLLTWGMLGLMLAQRDGRIAAGVVAGAICGILALCTPQFLPWAPLAATAIVLTPRRDRRARGPVGLAIVLAWLTVIAPWTLRNYAVFDRFIPVSTGDLGYSLWIGTFESNTNWTGWNEFPDEVFTSAAQKQAVLAERDRFLAATTVGSIRATESDRFFQGLARERLVADPLGCLWLGLRRLPRLWFQFYIPMYADREASGAYFRLYFVFAMVALLAAGADGRKRMVLLVMLFLYQNAVYLPLHVEPRQATPVLPSLLVLTACGVYATGRRVLTMLAPGDETSPAER